MDYLGFFGYEQTTDLFFEEAGSLIMVYKTII